MENGGWGGFMLFYSTHLTFKKETLGPEQIYIAE